MLHIKFQGNRSTGSGGDDFYATYQVSRQSVNWFWRRRYLCYISSLKAIGLLVLEKKIFMLHSLNNILFVYSYKIFKHINT